MKVVIDIGEADYDLLMKGEVVKKYLTKDYILATIPENHGRLIDADELKEVFNTTEDANYCQWSLNGIVSEIDDAETIIEAESEDKE